MNQTPFVSFIIVCQKVTEDNGVLNFYGIADDIFIKSTNPEMPIAPVDLSVAVSIFALDKGPSYASRLTMQLPSGKEIELGSYTLGNDAGKFIGRMITPFQFEFVQPGLYWVNLYLDGELRGQAPLLVRYERELVH
jgi:hypothetical protein